MDDVDVEDLTQMPGQDGFTGPTGANHKHFFHVLLRLGTGHERPGIRRYLALGEHTWGGTATIPRKLRYDARGKDPVPAHRENWLPQLCCHPLQCFGAGANTPLDLSHF
jgi:hypothetical protein